MPLLCIAIEERAIVAGGGRVIVNGALPIKRGASDREAIACEWFCFDCRRGCESWWGTILMRRRQVVMSGRRSASVLSTRRLENDTVIDLC
jgi:hypothetical protein